MIEDNSEMVNLDQSGDINLAYNRSSNMLKLDTSGLDFDANYEEYTSVPHTDTSII